MGPDLEAWGESWAGGRAGEREEAMRGQKGRVSWEVNYQRDRHGSGKHLSQGVMELGRKAQAGPERAMGAA